MERTLMPIGVASMSFTCAMPGASIFFTWAGSFLPASFASNPGIRLSSTMVVLPDPETPVTTVRAPFGKETLRGFTVWMSEVESVMAPYLKTLRPLFALSLFFPARKGPIFEAGSFVISFAVPWATTFPPCAPAPGPNSMIQSA